MVAVTQSSGAVRDYKIDNAKGLFIILVLLAHTPPTIEDAYTLYDNACIFFLFGNIIKRSD